MADDKVLYEVKIRLLASRQPAESLNAATAEWGNPLSSCAEAEEDRNVQVVNSKPMVSGPFPLAAIQGLARDNEWRLKQSEIGIGAAAGEELRDTGTPGL